MKRSFWDLFFSGAVLRKARNFFCSVSSLFQPSTVNSRNKTWCQMIQLLDSSFGVWKTVSSSGFLSMWSATPGGIEPHDARPSRTVWFRKNLWKSASLLSFLTVIPWALANSWFFQCLYSPICPMNTNTRTRQRAGGFARFCGAIVWWLYKKHCLHVRRFKSRADGKEQRESKHYLGSNQSLPTVCGVTPQHCERLK